MNHHQDIEAGLSDLFARTDFASLQATAQPFRESWVLGQPERCFLLFCVFSSEPSEVSASGGGPTDGRPGEVGSLSNIHLLSYEVATGCCIIPHLMQEIEL